MTHGTDPTRLCESASGAPEALRSLLAAGREDLPSQQQVSHLLAAIAPLAAPAAAAGASLGAKVVAVTVLGGALVGGSVWLMHRTAPVTPPPAPPSAATTPVAPAAPPAVPRAMSPAPVQPTGTAAPVAKPNLPTEAQLLQAAQAALRSDPARALLLTQEHQRRFPAGALSQEREVIAIDALSRLGRSGEARGRAQSFEQQYPGSAHRRKVDAAARGD